MWDVIVVGAGAAGLTAARRAREAGAEVLVLNKGQVGRTGATITSGGGISIAGETLIRLGYDADPADTEQVFAEDTIRSGKFIADQALVSAMVENIGAEVAALDAAGVHPRVVSRAIGHSSGRGVHISGVAMQKGVTRLAVRAGVRFHEDFASVGVLQGSEGAVAGMLGVDRRSGEVIEIAARAVVLATGGSTSNWRLRTAPEELSGDGQAMALAAGARLIEPEMLQFLPCCIVAPEMWKGIQFPWVIGPQAGIRAWLLNRFGERFMLRWDPVNAELATRDIVSAASAAEVAAGRGSPSGAVYLSWAHLPRDILENMATWSRGEWASGKFQGFDFTPMIERVKAGYAIEVMPAAHFSLGGIAIDADGFTGVPGLYAAGEAAGGVHGANRLSGNAGAQMLVQGAQAGRAAAVHARGTTAAPRPTNADALRGQALAPLGRAGGVAPGELVARIGAITERALSPWRSGATIAAGLAEIAAIRADALPRLAVRSTARAFNRDWATALDCESAVAVVEAALVGADRRRNSIGAHQRDDSAGEPPPPWHGLVRRGGDALVHETRPVAFPVLAP